MENGMLAKYCAVKIRANPMSAYHWHEAIHRLRGGSFGGSLGGSFGCSLGGSFGCPLGGSFGCSLGCSLGESLSCPLGGSLGCPLGGSLGCSFYDGSRGQSEAYIRGVREEGKAPAVWARREVFDDQLRRPAPAQAFNYRRENCHGQRAAESDPHAILTVKQRHGREGAHGQRHGIENIHLGDFGELRTRHARDPVTDAERECDCHDVAGAP